MKKTLLLALLLSVTASAFALEAEINGLWYNLVGNEATVIHYKNNVEYSGDIVIPETVEYNGANYSVTSIGYEAFRGCSGLTSVSIGNSVTSIGDGAFYGCSSLTSVTIPNSVSSIGERAFYNCSGLTSVHISDITSWCKMAFTDSYSNPLLYAQHLYLVEKEITDLVIPNSVTSIGNYTFSGCSGLTSVTIPNSVTSIGDGAFSGCSGLTSVTIPNSVTSIGKSVFSGCSSLTSVTIPNSVTSIGLGAFGGCSGLTSVTIPNSVSSIGERAFYNCSGLTSVSIPNSVTSIGDGAFSGCSGLTSVTIPNSVTSIGWYAFSGCSGLTSVTIPNSVTSIGRYAFMDCSSLTSVTIPNSVTSIGKGAFEYCRGLTSVTIGNSVTSIGESAFYGCSSLTSVSIPNSVTSIGDGAFSGCSIKTINIMDLSAWCISNYGPQLSSSYHLELNGVEIKNLKIPDGITTIGKSVFKGCSYTTSITIPSSVTFIDENAFENCIAAENLYLAKGLTYIRKASFKGCRSLKELTIPSSVEYIYQEAFAECTGLESVKALPDTPPFLYANSFSNYNIPLYASKTAIAAYQAKEPWSKFAQFLTLDGQEVEMPQCATPTIDYANWKLTFHCATKDAEIVSKAKVQDEKEGGDVLSLTPTYTITAYAKAEGYRDSEVATATIGWKNGRPVIIQGFSNVSLSDYDPNCDTNLDGTIDVADIATIIDAMASKSREEREE